jgi:2'-5' RNA ligase
MRAFFAFELPDSLREELAGLIDEASRLCPRNVKWVEPENLHITLQFLGDINDADIPGLDTFFTEAVGEYEAFPITKPKVDIVPGKSPRVIWTAFDTEYRHIFTLPAKILYYLEHQGYRDLDHKPLKLHATLGRVNAPLPPELISRLIGYRVVNRTGTVDTITLYKSTLRPQGPVYTPLYDYGL